MLIPASSFLRLDSYRSDLPSHLAVTHRHRAAVFSSRVMVVAIAMAVAVFGRERALAQRPIGIDVSDYQSPGINWVTLKNTYGISFAWAKASEGQGTAGGTNYTMFYAANAKAAGRLKARPGGASISVDCRKARTVNTVP